METALSLLKQMIAIDSTNPGTYEGGMMEFVTRTLRAAGVEPRWEAVEKGRCNLVATLPGAGEGALVLSGHMDTVVVGDGWTKDPFQPEEQEGRLYGRGSCDMKSGLACILAAFCNRAGNPLPLKKTLTLLCTVDEEGPMGGVEQAIRDGVVTAKDWVIDPEPTDGEIQMAHKGRLWLKMDFHGITAHASHPERGVDALAAAGEFIAQTRRFFAAAPVHPELGPSTVTFGQLQGGYQPYVVPDRAELWMDIRLAPPWIDSDVFSFLDGLQKDLEAAFPGLTILRTVTGNRPWIPRNEDSELLAAVKAACKAVTGSEPPVTAFYGYTDSAVIAGTLGNRNCLSYGPGNLCMAHKPDEYVALADVLRCEQVFSRLVQDLCG